MSVAICIGRPTIDRVASGEMVEVGQGVTIMAADDLFHASPYAEIEKLRRALNDLLEQIECLAWIEYSHDIEPYKAEACWDDAIRRAQDAIAKAEGRLP